MIFLLDNYDSFTYNLYQYLGEWDEVVVARNDEITIEEIEDLSPKGIVISPGPGKPKDAGITEEVIRHFSGKLPILGVCLGHQAIGEVFGGRIVPAEEIYHGKTSTIIHTGKSIFKNLPKSFEVTRYHSLVIDRESFPHDKLEILAETPQGTIMGVYVKEHPLTIGVQFHPESILSQYGKALLKNFYDLCG